MAAERSSEMRMYSHDVEKNEVARLIDEYESYKIRFPYVVLAQATWETNWFSSDIYKENENRFGMKFNRRGFCEKKNRGHAYYVKASNSIKDYAAWQKKVLDLHPCATEEEYLYVLDHLPFRKGARYAEDPEYTNHIRKRMAELKAIEGN